MRPSNRLFYGPGGEVPTTSRGSGARRLRSAPYDAQALHCEGCGKVFKRAEGKPPHIKVCLDYKKWVVGQSADLQQIQGRLQADLAILQQLPDDLRDALVRTVSQAAETKQRGKGQDPSPQNEDDEPQAD